MKILHTADIHLKDVDDKRWNALERVLSVGVEKGVSLVAISGDLFDRESGADHLKTALRDLFQKTSAKIVIIPGNHDGDAIVSGDFYGSNVSLLTEPGQFVDIDDVRVFGLPFDQIDSKKTLNRILSMKDSLREDGTNVLLFHGELVDMMFSRDNYGEEEEVGYMPVKLSYFAGLGVDYVLAGHFHSNFDVHTYDGGYFVYPGSPVSHSRKETGVRKVNVFETGFPPSEVLLDTPYFEAVPVLLDPFSGDDPLDVIRGAIAAAEPGARLIVTVGGFVDLGALGMNESDFAAAVEFLGTAQTEPIVHNWGDVSRVFENDLFDRSVERVNAKQIDEEQKTRVRRLIIQAMMEASRVD
jgi:exonuclease SbcD